MAPRSRWPIVALLDALQVQGPALLRGILAPPRWSRRQVEPPGGTNSQLFSFFNVAKPTLPGNASTHMTLGKELHIVSCESTMSRKIKRDDGGGVRRALKQARAMLLESKHAQVNLRYSTYMQGWEGCDLQLTPSPTWRGPPKKQVKLVREKRNQGDFDHHLFT